ncbi:MAG: hypothetical protein ACR2JP_11535 [Acidimicrobiia bacterium]
MTPAPPPAGTGRNLVDDVRRLGIDVATEIVARFARMVAPLDGGLGWGAGGDGRLASDVSAAVKATLRVLEDLAGMAGRLVGDGSRTDGVERLVVPIGAAGGSGRVLMWLHNTTEEPATGVTFDAVDLVGGAGRLPGSVVSIEPAAIATIPAGTSRELTVTVTAPVGTAPGVYHGLVVAPGFPGAALALLVDIEPATRGPKAL